MPSSPAPFLGSTEVQHPPQVDLRICTDVSAPPPSPSVSQPPGHVTPLRTSTTSIPSPPSLIQNTTISSGSCRGQPYQFTLYLISSGFSLLGERPGWLTWPVCLTHLSCLAKKLLPLIPHPVASLVTLQARVTTLCGPGLGPCSFLGSMLL